MVILSSYLSLSICFLQKTQGLWAWNVSQLLTPKFWRLVKKDGLLQTYVRGHKTRRAAHDVGGRLGPVKCVGMDNFGNKYYEDFDVDCKPWETSGIFKLGLISLLSSQVQQKMGRVL
jgi:hypothetical protein